MTLAGLRFFLETAGNEDAKNGPVRRIWQLYIDWRRWATQIERTFPPGQIHCRRLSIRTIGIRLRFTLWTLILQISDRHHRSEFLSSNVIRRLVGADPMPARHTSQPLFGLPFLAW